MFRKYCIVFNQNYLYTLTLPSKISKKSNLPPLKVFTCAGIAFSLTYRFINFHFWIQPTIFKPEKL